jgi:hypothetical protein
VKRGMDGEKVLDLRVQELLERLLPAYRMAVLLYDFERFTYKEIAEILEVPKKTVMARRKTGVRRLFSMASELGLSDLVRQELEAWNSPAESSLILSSAGITLLDPGILDAIMKYPNLLRTLDWREFEKLLAQILEKLGYEIELQRGTKDGGIDLFALKRDTVLGPHRYLLQAKRSSNAVGVEPIREILFLRDDHRITKSCLATTSRFTAGAWKYARAYEWWLELKDFDRLQEWVRLAAEGSVGNNFPHNLSAAPDVNRASRSRRR